MLHLGPFGPALLLVRASPAAVDPHLLHQVAQLTASHVEAVLGRLLSGACTAARYLGIVAVVGLVFAAGATALFFGLADEIGVGESLAAFDVALSAALRERVTHDTLAAFAAITHLGDRDFLLGVGTIVFACLLALRHTRLAAAWLYTTLGGALLNPLLKRVFARRRPLHDHDFVVATGWSFPSGHASGSLLVYGMLVYLVVRHTRPAFHMPIATLGIVLIIVIGASRVILQVHYLSDVLAGYMSAAAWVALCIAALEALRWRERHPGNSRC
ncbi:MAG: phosphatase PAP2 family protein [Gammaproteobacteria bacterium]|nr:phosphatase PAP2 family protein [Gammaproteobacteria bacterium]